MLKPSNTPIYGNCGAVDDEGNLLFRCDLRKMRWYLRKGLAEQVQDSPPRIKLLFEPRGSGHKDDPFFLQPRKNVCVVCGTNKALTRHHILPHCYRRWFPRSLDVYGTYDVMALCIDDHEDYETRSLDLRAKLAQEYSAPINGVGGRACPDTNSAAKSAHAIMHWGDKIPSKKRAKLKKHVEEFFGIKNPTVEHCREIARRNRGPYKTHAQLVVEKFDSDVAALGQFVIRWRSHFVSTMSPQFLPDHWEIDRVFLPRNSGE